MSKARIIVSATVEGVTAKGNAAAHHALLTRQLSKFPDNSIAHAIGMFEGKEELSLVIEIPNVPFITLAATAHALCLDYGQKSVYFSREGKAYLATCDGDMVHLGKECEGELKAVADTANYTRIIGTKYYIWTVK